MCVSTSLPGVSWCARSHCPPPQWRGRCSTPPRLQGISLMAVSGTKLTLCQQFKPTFQPVFSQFWHSKTNRKVYFSPLPFKCFDDIWVQYHHQDFLTFWIFRSLWILNVKYENRYNSDIKIFDMTWYFRLVTELLPESSWKFWHNKFYFSLVREFLPIKSFLEVLSQSQTSMNSLLSLSSCFSSLNTSDCPIMLSLKNLTVSKSRSTRDSRFPW